MSISANDLAQEMIKFVKVNFVPFLNAHHQLYPKCIENWNSLEELLSQVQMYSLSFIRKEIETLRIHLQSPSHKSEKVSPNFNNPLKDKALLPDVQIPDEILPRMQHQNSLEEEGINRKRNNSIENQLSLGSGNKDEPKKTESNRVISTSPLNADESSHQFSYKDLDRQNLNFRALSDYQSRRRIESAVLDGQRNNPGKTVVCSHKSIDGEISKQLLGSSNYIESIKRIRIEDREKQNLYDINLKREQESKNQTQQTNASPKVRFIRDPRISPSASNNRSLTLNSTVDDRQRRQKRLNTLEMKVVDQRTEKIPQNREIDSSHSEMKQNTGQQPSEKQAGFEKIMSSFKKLCSTFQSNHQKLIREDFSNKYVNC